MQLASLAGATGLAVMAAFGVAQATPLTGTYSITIYQGTGNGSSSAPIEQANNTNPLLSSTALGTITYTGALDFNLGGSGNGTIGAFLASGGGSITGNESYFGDALSSYPFSVTTLFSITGSTASPVSGMITHDDGATVYQGGVAVGGSAAPTEAVPNPYSLKAGSFNIIYVEANGLPAELDVQVPEPASLALLGAGLLGLGVVRRSRRASRDTAA